MGITRSLLAPLRLAEQIAGDLEAIVQATQSLPRFERALSTQLSSLLARVGELGLQLDQVPAPLQDISRELPSIGLGMGALHRDVEDVSATVDEMAGAVAPIDARLAAVEVTLDRLSGQLAHLQGSLESLSATVKDAAEHLPDPNGAGLLTKARDALSGAATSA